MFGVLARGMHREDIMIEIKVNSVAKRTRNIVFSKLEDELLAVDGEAGNCYSLNETAGRIWELIDEPVPISEICAQLCSKYTVDWNTCERDVIELLQGLCAAGLVQCSDGK